MDGKRMGHEITMSLYDEWLQAMQAMATDVITMAADEFRERHKMRPEQQIYIVWPWNESQRGEFARLSELHVDNPAYKFDWGMWPIERRPRKALTEDEAQRICDRVNIKFEHIRRVQVAYAGTAVL